MNADRRMFLSSPMPDRSSARSDAEAGLNFLRLLDAAPDAMVVVNERDEIVLVNNRAERQFGYRGEELRGLSLKTIIRQGPARQSTINGSAADAPGMPARSEVECQARRKDGTTFPVELLLGTFAGPDGVLAVATVRDVTARKRTEDALRESEAKFRGFLDSAPDGVVISDAEGHIVLVNAQTERLFGYHRQELIGQTVEILIPDRLRHRHPGHRRRYGKRQHARPMGEGAELFGRRKDGSEFPVEISLGPIETTDGTLISSAIRDVTARKSAERALRASELRFHGILESAPDATVIADAKGRIILVNAQTERMFGYARQELVGQKVEVLVPKPQRVRHLQHRQGFAHHPESRPMGEGMELFGLRKDGSTFAVQISLNPLESAEGMLVTASIRDITAPREAERHLREMERMEEALFAEKERAQVTLDSIGDAVVCSSAAGLVTFMNVAAQSLTNWLAQEAMGRPMGEVLPIFDVNTREPFGGLAVSGAEPGGALGIGSTCVLIRRNGTEIPVEGSVAPIHDRDGNATGQVFVLRDVSIARAMTRQVTYSAQHDFLTGLPNRMLLNDRIANAISIAPRHNKKVAVLFLDLDGFKHINDSLGHPVGDRLLQSVAARLIDCVRSSDTVSRQGGDEFVILLSEIELAEDAAILARRMLGAVAEGHSVGEHELHVTTSIGIGIYPDDGLDAETLIKSADTAMYQAKENGRQSYQFFRPIMNARAVERQSIEESLRRALERREFSLLYQPKVNLTTGEITGAEALIRWRHPTRGPISPTLFIPVAEDSGLIMPIGVWVLREACAQARRWCDQGLPATSIAVNVSAIEFRDERFLPGVFAVLEETGLAPEMLELELTESVLMRHAESTASVLRSLRNSGVRVTVDDFGTGYSSLSYLRKFPVDTLKIDQSFVRQISSANEDTAIVTAVIGMARNLKLRVVAEGVETREELAFLRQQNCDEAQGHYFSRPILPAEFAVLLRKNQSRRLDVIPGMDPAS